MPKQCARTSRTLQCSSDQLFLAMTLWVVEMLAIHVCPWGGASLQDILFATRCRKLSAVCGVVSGTRPMTPSHSLLASEPSFFVRASPLRVIGPSPPRSRANLKDGRLQNAVLLLGGSHSRPTFWCCLRLSCALYAITPRFNITAIASVSWSGDRCVLSWGSHSSMLSPKAAQVDVESAPLTPRRAVSDC